MIGLYGDDIITVVIAVKQYKDVEKMMVFRD